MIIFVFKTYWMLRISSIYDSLAMYVKYHIGSTNNTSLIVTQIYNCLPFIQCSHISLTCGQLMTCILWSTYDLHTVINL